MLKKIMFLSLIFVALLPLACMAQGADVNYSYVEDGALYMGVTLEAPQDDSALYIAVYTKNGILTNMCRYTVEDNSYSIDATVSDFSLNGGDFVKVLYFSKNLAPLTEAVYYDVREDYLTGIVTATPIIGGYFGADEVEIEITGANGCYAEEEYIGEYITFEHNIANINDYYGMEVKIFAEKTTYDTMEITDIYKSDNCKVITLEKGDIDTFTNSEIKYYETAYSIDTTNIKLDSLCDYEDCIINNEPTAISDVLYLGDDAEIKIIENNGDGKYDIIVAKEYIYGIVESIDTQRWMLALENIPGRFSFDFEDEEVCNILLNSNGKAISFSDISKGDVIACISEDGRKSGFGWIEIINLSKNYVQGCVTEVNYSTNSVFIDDSEYRLSENFYAPDVGVYGIFYLTKNNKIFSGVIDEFAGFEYAYILDIGMNTAPFSANWQFKLLNSDGTIAIYDTIDNFIVNGEKCGAEDYSIGGLENLTETSFKEDIPQRLVTVKFGGTDNNYIIEIKSPSNFIPVGDDSSGQEYDEDNFRFGSTIISENSLVFNVSDNDADSSCVATTGALIDGNPYIGYLASKVEDNFDCVVITSGECNHDETEPGEDIPVGINNGYVLEIAKSEQAFTSIWQIKILTDDNNIAIYDFKDRFVVNGVSYSGDDDEIGGLEELEYSSFAEDADKRYVTYRLDADGKISDIDNISTMCVIGSYEHLIEYNGSERSIDNKILEEDATVYNLTKYEADDSYTGGVDTLVNGCDYAGYLVMDSDGKYTAFIILANSGGVDYTQDISIVDSVNVIIYNDDEAWKIKYYTEGDSELKELIVTPGTNAVASTDLIDEIMYSLSKGSTFMFTADKNGIATDFVFLANANSATDASSPAYVLNDHAVNEIDDCDNLEFAAGYIVDIQYTAGGTMITYENDDNEEGIVFVKDTASAYTYYNMTASKIMIVPGDWMGTSSIDVMDDDMATYFYAIVEDGIVSDIVTFSTRKYI